MQSHKSESPLSPQEFIDKYLPSFYARTIAKKMGMETTPENITMIRNVKQGRTKDNAVFLELMKLAKQNKKHEADIMEMIK